MTPAIFSTLHHAADASVGARLFTITVLDHKAGLARRAYTSHPAEYPTTGTKPMRDDPWSDQVIGRGISFVANSTPEFATYFVDHALINALGCQAAINIPVAQDGVVLGTVNILDKAGHFTPDCVAKLEALVDTHHAALLAAFATVPMGDAP